MDRSRKWTVVVTGAAGFLGSTIVKLMTERCSADVKTIRAFDVMIAKDEPVHEHSSGIRVEYIQGDICDYSQVRDVLKEVDIVLHCASYIDISPDDETATKLANINIGGTKNIIDACKENEVPFLIYTSTLEVVMKSQQFYQVTGNESLPVYTSDRGYLYAYTKAVAEQMVLNYNNDLIGTNKDGRSLKLRTCSLRPVTIYGENGSEKAGISAALYEAKKLGGVMPKIGFRPRPYQMVYVGNVAWAHIKAMEMFRENPEKVAGNPYFVTDDTPLAPFHKQCEPFLSALGYRLTSIAIPFTLLYFLVLFGEIVAWILKPIFSLRLKLKRFTIERLYYGHNFTGNKLYGDTGYTPCYTPEESFKRTMRSFMENLGE